MKRYLVRVDALNRLIGWLGDWLKKLGTEPTLQKTIITYLRGRGNCTAEV